MTPPTSLQNNENDVTFRKVSGNLRGLDSTVYFASFLGDNALDFYRQIVAYLNGATGTSTDLVSALPSEMLDQMVDAGKIQVVFTCGLPYVRKADHDPPLLRLIAAPVMLGARYRDRPVYFSDIIVRSDSGYQSFDDLRGATFGYNETCSLSGYRLPLYHLQKLGETLAFFGDTVCSGSHAASMDWVENGQVDVAAVDSVVLDMELIQHPERRRSLRVIENIGPVIMPPVAASVGLTDTPHRQIKDALLTMHTTEQGRKILDQGGVRRFAPVVDHDYNQIRQIMRALRSTGIAP